jgi:hypothetical protein
MILYNLLENLLLSTLLIAVVVWIPLDSTATLKNACTAKISWILLVKRLVIASVIVSVLFTGL